MDSQYEGGGAGDYDVVRSTQFGDDFGRGVRALNDLMLKVLSFLCKSVSLIESEAFMY